MSSGHILCAIDSGDLVGIIGQYSGQKLTFLLDSGASTNFISKDLVDALGLQIQNQQQYQVRLADGKLVSTVGQVQFDILFGSFLDSCKFYVLDCEVPLILGMQWLADVQPIVDFQNKKVFIKHKNVLYSVPTCSISSSSGLQQ